MNIILWILIGWVVWFFIGCLVLAFIDTDDGQLLKWATACPVPLGYGIVVSLWPVILYFWWKHK